MEPSSNRLAIINILKDSVEVKTKLLNDDDIITTIDKIVEVCVHAFKNDHKLLLCGNGGSASDAQHLAAELSGRFYMERNPLFAEALHVNSSFVTAVANDYSFEEVYRRAVMAKGRKGDVLLGISTSGSSQNIINAMITAQNLEMTTIALTGKNPNPLSELCDYCIMVPSDDTPRIQECHITIGHILCELIEKKVFLM